MDNIHDQYNGDPMLTSLLSSLEDHPEALSAVKYASFDAEAAKSLPSSAFAWDAERRYPMHTREDTIASIAYRSKCAAAVPKFVDQRLAEAADAFGIQPSLFRSSARTTKIASAVVNYALPDEKRLPLHSSEQVKVASHVLRRDGHALSLPERVQAFAKVAAAAVAQGMPLDKEIGAYAGLNVCHTQMLCDRVGMRTVTTKSASLSAAYDTLEQSFRKLPPTVSDRSLLLKLASKIDQLDEQAGIKEQYGKKIFDPMKTVFNGGEKIANDDKTKKLMAIPPEVWKQVDVEEMIDIAASGDEEKFMQVYATLPMDIKVTLEKQVGC